MDRSELAGWLRLLMTPGLGREGARRLLAALGPPDAIFRAPADAWTGLAGTRAARALATPPEGFPELLEATWAWLDAGPGQRRVVTLGDPLYPAALLSTADPPLLLHLQGRLEGLARGWPAAVAVVGSRNPTAQGLDNAHAFARSLAGAGLCVVSGLALGIDGAAHEGALAAGGEDGAGNALATVAVLGTGLDRVYPARHQALARRIAARGLLVSEFPLGTPPLSANFPLRNRIIAGLSSGTLVVEATLRSGSLITARLAAEQGREVFAIPGSIHAPQSHGCHALIREGAKLVESAQDVLEELQPGLGPAATSASRDLDGKTVRAGSGTAAEAPAEPPPPAPRDDPVLAALGHEPAGLDALVARCGWPAGELQARLLELELAGQVARLPGGLYQRRANA